MTKIIKVRLGARSYPIIIQPGLINRIGRILALLKFSGNAIIITDRNVASLYFNKVVSSLRKSGLTCLSCIIPAGEEQKSLATVNRIYDFLLRNKIERGDVIIALGGGVIGDMAGFAAGTYKRGMRLIQVPTSLMAQVDSGIGGKTGVNHPLGKNLIGMFYQPSSVLIDPMVLKTLPKREFANGMSEVIKAAIIKNAGLFRLLSDKHQQIMKLNPAVLGTMIERAIRVKKALVEQDEYDTKGTRILLNYGHTVGHILESLGQYQDYRHGEAVAIGMMAAARMAQQMGLVKDDFIMKQEELLRMYKLPVALKKPIRFLQAVRFLKQDKKIIDGKIVEVLPIRIGLAKAYKIPLDKFR